MICPEAGTSFTISTFVVRIVLRHDNPAFPKYVIFCRGRFIGTQFSRPCLSDCQWLQRQRGVYATNTIDLDLVLLQGATKKPMDARRERGGIATSSRRWNSRGL